MRIQYLNIAIFAAIFVISTFSLVQAQPPMPPCFFFGTVTIGGLKAPDGLNITAVIANTSLKWTTQTVNGTYGWQRMGSKSFYIPSATPEATKDGGIDKDIIEFYINKVKTEQTSTFVSFTSKRVDLSVEQIPDITTTTLTTTTTPTTTFTTPTTTPTTITTITSTIVTTTTTTTTTATTTTGTIPGDNVFITYIPWLIILLIVVAAIIMALVVLKRKR